MPPRGAKRRGSSHALGASAESSGSAEGQWLPAGPRSWRLDPGSRLGLSGNSALTPDGVPVTTEGFLSEKVRIKGCFHKVHWGAAEF